MRNTRARTKRIIDSKREMLALISFVCLLFLWCVNWMCAGLAICCLDLYQCNISFIFARSLAGHRQTTEFYMRTLLRWLLPFLCRLNRGARAENPKQKPEWLICPRPFQLDACGVGDGRFTVPSRNPCHTHTHAHHETPALQFGHTFVGM